MLSERAGAMSKHLDPGGHYVAQDHASHWHITHTVVPGEIEMLRQRPCGLAQHDNKPVTAYFLPAMALDDDRCRVRKTVDAPNAHALKVTRETRRPVFWRVV